MFMERKNDGKEEMRDIMSLLKYIDKKTKTKNTEYTTLYILLYAMDIVTPPSANKTFQAACFPHEALNRSFIGNFCPFYDDIRESILQNIQYLMNRKLFTNTNLNTHMYTLFIHLLTSVANEYESTAIMYTVICANKI